ncbi:MAG: hypothetical protein MZW92_16740 [Comamonadaceae bacterium]|nr:hypothetical protein [Comamonadaceae bacterium]
MTLTVFSPRLPPPCAAGLIKETQPVAHAAVRRTCQRAERILFRCDILLLEDLLAI